MKYQSGKIKSEHHILPDFKEFLKKIEEIEEIKRIIPARISRQQKGSGGYRITFSYFTESGMKYNLKKGATAQELFVICKKEFREKVKEKIGEFIISNIK